MAELLNLKDHFKNLQIKDLTDINILLLGEKGVGKSTFINALANYFTHVNFEKALKEKLLVFIPTELIINDTAGKKHKIIIGSDDKAEYVYAGEKTFQNVRTYIFQIPNKKLKIRLIDTFGMGHSQDDTNCENILNYISNLHQLHAICFLVKPPNTTFSTCFRYCIKRIFSHLEKTASRNIAFIFTNINSPDYSPKDSLDLLNQAVEDVKKNNINTEIPMGRNIFCFDNEAFIYLAAHKNGIQNMELDESKAKRSWNECLEQCCNLISYIKGSNGFEPIKPHFVNNTNAINATKKIIAYLSQPLADVAQVIGYNIDALQKHQKNLNFRKRELDELKSILFMPVVNLETLRLAHPVTVCTTCAEVIQEGDINLWNYTQVCHKTCFVGNIRNCMAMNAQQRCNICSCDCSEHMHIYYMTKIKQIENNIANDIDSSSKEVVLACIEKLKSDINMKVVELEQEYNNILKISAKFANFLQLNTLTSFNDNFKDYVEYLLKRENSIGESKRNTKAVNYLKTVLIKYEDYKKNGDDNITPKTIFDAIDSLYKLKHNGGKIKEMYELQKAPRKREHENSEYEYKIKVDKPKKEQDKIKQTSGEESSEVNKSKKKSKTPQNDKEKNQKNGGPSKEKMPDKSKENKNEKDKNIKKTDGVLQDSKPENKTKNIQKEKEKSKQKSSDDTAKENKSDTSKGNQKEKDKSKQKSGDDTAKEKKSDISKSNQKEKDKSKQKSDGTPKQSKSESKLKEKDKIKESNNDKRSNMDLPPAYSELPDINLRTSGAFDPSLSHPFASSSTDYSNLPPRSAGVHSTTNEQRDPPQIDGKGPSISKINISVNLPSTNSGSQAPPVGNQYSYGPQNYPPGPHNYPQGGHYYPPGPHNYPPGPYNYPTGPHNYPPGPQSPPPMSHNYPPGPPSYTPGTPNYPSGPHNYPPSPHNYHPGPHNYSPGPYNYPPGPYNYPPSPHNHPPGPGYPPGPHVYPPHYSQSNYDRYHSSEQAFKKNRDSDKDSEHSSKGKNQNHNKNVKQSNINKAKSKLRNKKTEKKSKTKEDSSTESERSE